MCAPQITNHKQKSTSNFPLEQDDSYQLKNDIGVNPTFWTEEMCHYAESPFRFLLFGTEYVKSIQISSLKFPEWFYFRSGMVATLEAVWNRGHVVFGAACYMHGLLTSPDWQTLEVIFHGRQKKP